MEKNQLDKLTNVAWELFKEHEDNATDPIYWKGDTQTLTYIDWAEKSIVVNEEQAKEHLAKAIDHQVMNHGAVYIYSCSDNAEIEILPDQELNDPTNFFKDEAELFEPEDSSIMTFIYVVFDN